MLMKNLFDSLEVSADAEAFETLHESSEVLVERIVSLGHASPAGFWYDQPRAEFVALLQGQARLRFEDEETARELKAGDSFYIAAHRRHRVEWTTPEAPSVWLAVHFRD
jgi:cupin 2 domain-containing protein